MNTVSLRHRVTWTSVAVSGAVLVLVAIVVHTLFGVVVNRSETTLLNDRIQLARQLAQEDITPAELIQRVDNRSVRARLVLADNQAFGSLSLEHANENAVKTRRVQLTGPGQIDHAKLTLQIDTPLLTRVQRRLTWLLAAATATAIVVIAAALWIGVRAALAPLDGMTRVARDIARGRRGQRLEPSRTDTELGRTAAAFDEMLDELEGALDTTAAALHQAEQAEARARASEQRIRSFVGDAAHELRTPIAGIRALAEAVVQQPADADPEEIQRMHLLLVREAHRAGRLVDDLLDLARIDSGLQLRREPVGLYDLAAAQLDRMRMLHPDIKFRLDGTTTPVIADAERINQIVLNLLSNACQAMTDGGAVTIHVTSDDDYAELAVADTGPGVPEADRERIFDRLVRLDQARDHRADGSGLGLSIARGLARAHGGDLTCVEPRNGHGGALFVLRLPLTEEPL